MFGISIRIEDGLYRRGQVVAAAKIHCTVDVIENQGFTFAQALKLQQNLESRRQLQSVFEQNGNWISEEEIRNIASANNIAI